MILGKAFAATSVKLAVGGALVATAAGGTAAASAVANHPAPSTPHTAFGQSVKEQVEACKTQTQVSVGECVSTFTTAHNPGATRHAGDTTGDDRPKPTATATPTATPSATPDAGPGSDGDAAEDATEPAAPDDVDAPRASPAPVGEHHARTGHDGDAGDSGSTGHGDAH